MPREISQRIVLWSPVALAAMAYLPSLLGGFVYDDRTITVLADPFVQGRIGWLEALMRDRPLRGFSYAFDWWLWVPWLGQERAAFGFHLQNLVWHVLNVYLFARLCERLGVERRFATAAAAVFAVHPMGCEAVTWISGRKDLLCLAFGLLTLHANLSFLQEERLGRRALGYAFASLLTLTLALLSKQVAVMLPVLGAIAILLARRNAWLFPPQRAFALIGLQLGLVAVVSLLWLRLGDAVAMTAQGTFRDPGVQGIEWTGRSALLTGSLVWGKVHRLLLLPWDPTLERRILPVTEWSDLRWLMGPLWTFAVAGFLWAARKQTRVPHAGYLWIAAAWVPTSGLLPIAYLMADRYLYIPSVGYGLLVAGVLGAVSQWLPGFENRKRILGIALFCVALLFARTWTRTLDWRNETALLRCTLLQVGEDPRLLSALGRAYSREGDWEPALEALGRAVTLDPDYLEARLNLGLAWRSSGNLEAAEAQYREALRRDPTYGTAQYNLGILLEEKGETEAALEAFRIASRTLKSKADTNARRARALVQIARIRLAEPNPPPEALGEAARCLNRALAMNPTSAAAWDYEGRRLLLKGRHKPAGDAWNRSLELDPHRAETAFNLGVWHLQAGNREAAERFFARALESDPGLDGQIRAVRQRFGGGPSE